MPQNLTPPKKGAMYLFDYITPPLRPDLYRLEVSTEVAYDDETPKLEDEKYFEVVGPRFSLPPTDIAGVFPPRNGRGPYEGSLAQVVIRRRTLPWEREMDKNKLIGNTTLSDPLPASYPVPWMALLLFEETEFELLENVPLENVVPKSVFERLGSPANILCNAVEADSQLVRDIMPSKEELQLLAHVRWVNTDDRELNVEGSDGWFAVVMTNRLPRAGTKCRACLVSLEERTDLVKADPPKTYLPQQGSDLDVLDPGLSMVRDFHLYKTKGVDRHRVVEQRSDTLQGKLTSVITRTRLVLLHSWQFTCEGAGTFYGLMQGLDVGLIGKTKKAGQPALTDTGHIHLKLQDRSGVEETVWYRGPLVPFELTRDPLGPYHSADQARRASPETGAEDISYAAAFEVGRLLAAADPRLAQELMRWRREMYRQSGRARVISVLEDLLEMNLPPLVADKIQVALLPLLAQSSIEQLVAGAGPIADRYGINAASKSIGMQPKMVAQVWNLNSVEEAQVLLGGVAGTLGIETVSPNLTARADTNIDDVLADTASLQQLKNLRDRIMENVNIKLGGQ